MRDNKESLERKHPFDFKTSNEIPENSSANSEVNSVNVYTMKKMDSVNDFFHNLSNNSSEQESFVNQPIDNGQTELVDTAENLEKKNVISSNSIDDWSILVGNVSQHDSNSKPKELFHDGTTNMFVNRNNHSKIHYGVDTKSKKIVTINENIPEHFVASDAFDKNSNNSYMIAGYQHSSSSSSSVESFSYSKYGQGINQKTYLDQIKNVAEKKNSNNKASPSVSISKESYHSGFSKQIMKESDRSNFLKCKNFKTMQFPLSRNYSEAFSHFSKELPRSIRRALDLDEDLFTKSRISSFHDTSKNVEMSKKKFDSVVPETLLNYTVSMPSSSNLGPNQVQHKSSPNCLRRCSISDGSQISSLSNDVSITSVKSTGSRFTEDFNTATIEFTTKSLPLINDSVKMNTNYSPNVLQTIFSSNGHMPLDPCKQGFDTLNDETLDQICSDSNTREVDDPVNFDLDDNLVPDPATPILYIVVRHIPHRISALIPNSILGNLHSVDKPRITHQSVQFVNNGCEKLKTYNLTMSQAHCVQWQIERNEFDLDFSDSSLNSIKKIIVGDPNIIFSNFSLDINVQITLKRSLQRFLLSHSMIPVFVNDFPGARRERYSEEVLSPLFHYLTPSLSTGFHHLDWTGYRELNLIFLNTLVQCFNEGDWILIFNHHLMLLPKMLRERPLTRSATIGFYLGTVFPSSEMYRILPQREELLKGVLAASFIGFNGFQYKHHFLTACTGVLGLECSGDRIEPNSIGRGAGARLVSVPRGINPEPWLREFNKISTLERITHIKEKLKNRKVLLGIDTLDYTKGIPHKILAFNKFLTDHPEWASNVVYLQICVDKRYNYDQNAMNYGQNNSKSRVNRKDFLTNIYQLVGSINANYGSILHQPIHFLLSPLNLENLVSLYGLADVILVTPLRESLSWTAYEFVLCQSFTNKGVLILSEFSASAQSLGASAICVNPWDSYAMSSAIHDALTMKDEEKLARHEYAYNYILNYDSKSWGRELILEFQEAIADIEAECRSIPDIIFRPRFCTHFNNTSHCLIVLGVRGTLFPYSYPGIDPQLTGKIRLSKMIRNILRILCQDDTTHILIISSSSCSVMNEALGEFHNITLMAENGHYEKPGKLKYNYERYSDSSDVQSNFKNIQLQMSDEKLSSFSNEKSFCKYKLRNKDIISSNFNNELEQNYGFILRTPQVDLSWMDHVQETCKYFEERTPGSFVYRISTSVAWNYHGAQRDHGTLQACDLLIHLWAGPATVAAQTDIVVGPHSVEVRSSATCKAESVERWLKDTIHNYDLDPMKCFVLCAANFLPRDEDVFSAVSKVMNPSLLKDSEFVTAGEVFPKESFISSESDKNIVSLVTPSNDTNTKPKLYKDDSNLYTCTVGLKPSLANFLLNDEKDVKNILMLLSCLIIKRKGIPPYNVDILHNTIDSNKNILSNENTNPFFKPFNIRGILTINLTMNQCYFYPKSKYNEIRFIFIQNSNHMNGGHPTMHKHVEKDHSNGIDDMLLSEYELIFRQNSELLLSEESHILTEKLSENFFLVNVDIALLIESYDLQYFLISSIHYYYTKFLEGMPDIPIHILNDFDLINTVSEFHPHKELYGSGSSTMCYHTDTSFSDYFRISYQNNPYYLNQSKNLEEFDSEANSSNSINMDFK